MALQLRVDTLRHHVLLVDAEPLLAHVPVRRQAFWQRQIDISVTETTLDSLLEALDHVNSGRQPQNRNRRLSGLSNVEEIVKKRLPSVRRKQVEFVYDEYDGPGRHAMLGFRYLGGVRQEREQRGHGISIAGCLLWSAVVALDRVK